MYGIGSVSKMLATVAIMQLATRARRPRRSLLALRPVVHHPLPAWRQITVRMPMNHSSGLPGSNYPNLFTATYWPGYLQETLDTLAAEHLKTTPGYMSVYCNDGFTLRRGARFRRHRRELRAVRPGPDPDPLGHAHTTYPLMQFPDGADAKCYAGDRPAHPRRS